MVEKEKLVGIIHNFKGKKIAVIGDLALDAYIYGVIERVNPEKPSAPLLKATKVNEYRLGCAGNVAANLAALGAEVCLYGLLGEDGYTDIAMNLCERKGITLKPIIEGESIVKLRVIEVAHNGYLSRVDLGESNLKPISEEASKKILEEIGKEKFDAILVSDYNKRMFKGNLGPKIINIGREKGIPVFADPKPSNVKSFFGAKVIKPNEKEAREIVGGEHSKKPVEEVIQILKSMTACDYAIMTLGAEGTIGYGDKIHRAPTKARDVIDVTGAGDTVIASLTLAMISGADLTEALHISNYCAGIVVEKTGTATASPEELINRIESDGNELGAGESISKNSNLKKE